LIVGLPLESQWWAHRLLFPDKISLFWSSPLLGRQRASARLKLLATHRLGTPQSRPIHIFNDVFSQLGLASYIITVIAVTFRTPALVQEAFILNRKAKTNENHG
jgi:hypothetical protein